MRRALAALALSAMVAAGCGARWTDAQRAELTARSTSPVAATGPGGLAADGDRTADLAAADGSGSSPATGGGAGSAAGARTGPGGGAGGGGGARPCAAPSDAPGVTDEAITFGSISSTTGPVPGLGASAAAAARAYAAYRNATGGVCGRMVVVRDVDDGSDTARYRALLRELGPQVIAFAGGLTIADDGSAEIIRNGAIPMLAARSAEGVQGQPTVFDFNPPYPDLSKPIGRYQYLYDQGARTAVLAYLAVDASRLEAQTQQSLMEASGVRVVDVVELPISTLSFDSPARRVANSGADYMLFIGDAGSNASMARALAGTGTDVIQDYFSYVYGEAFISLVGAAAEGATTWNRTLPNEEAGSNEEVAAFVAWMSRANPGLPQDAFAAESWAAVKGLFDSLEALPGPITREGLVAQLRATDTYDAGGMMGPIRLGAQENLGCFVGLQVQGGEWRRMAPASGFLCG